MALIADCASQNQRGRTDADRDAGCHLADLGHQQLRPVFCDTAKVMKDFGLRRHGTKARARYEMVMPCGGPRAGAQPAADAGRSSGSNAFQHRHFLPTRATASLDGNKQRRLKADYAGVTGWLRVGSAFGMNWRSWSTVPALTAATMESNDGGDSASYRTTDPGRKPFTQAVLRPGFDGRQHEPDDGWLALATGSPACLAYLRVKGKTCLA